MGDKKACVAGASDTQAIAAIKRDTGYAIRFIGPHTALAYDWLHDAPGVDEASARQSRDCFRAWIDYYTKSGYLNDVPGANYHAGYVAAKTFISIAEAGEDGVSSDKMWTETVDDVFGKQLVGKGLAPTGALSGGDWAEGWQYGPLSVLEYALSARALEEQGVALPAMHQWANRFRRCGSSTGSFLRATLRTSAGTRRRRRSTSSRTGACRSRPSRDRAAIKRPDGPHFSGRTSRRTRTIRPCSTRSARRAPSLRSIRRRPKLPLWYLAKGTRNVYARSSFEKDAFFAVFTSAPRVVPITSTWTPRTSCSRAAATICVVDPLALRIALVTDG